ncbi:hypothetical protein [Propionivibrio sp.]|uniref:hypothetical protein n=1 Tax=Propionivibrio sp. TaxID=2212460 RepID=UPI003BEFDECD
MKQTLAAGFLSLAVGAAPVVAVESPYLPLAQAGGGGLVLKEDPAKYPVLLELLGKFKRKTILERLPTLTVSQRERIMGYYKLARSQPEISERTIANGVSGMVLGYVEIEDVRRFVEEYTKTGKLPKGLPLPFSNFKNASEKFPGAENYLASELSSTKKLDEQISVILDAVIADAEKKASDADKKASDADKKASDADKAGEIARKKTVENRKQIELLEQLLKAMPQR